jgi:hypothetical protein
MSLTRKIKVKFEEEVGWEIIVGDGEFLLETHWEFKKGEEK